MSPGGGDITCPREAEISHVPGRGRYHMSPGGGDITCPREGEISHVPGRGRYHMSPGGGDITCHREGEISHVPGRGRYHMSPGGGDITCPREGVISHVPGRGRYHMCPGGGDITCPREGEGGGCNTVSPFSQPTIRLNPRAGIWSSSVLNSYTGVAGTDRVESGKHNKGIKRHAIVHGQASVLPRLSYWSRLVLS